MRQHCENLKRTVHVVNLDPAADQFKYPASIDIRELISIDDVMEELHYGPNGGLVYCMEYLSDNLDWLRDQLGEYEDDYLLIDCPGQLELYSHVAVMPKLVQALRRWGYNMCAVYLIDSQFISDSAKFMSGVLLCLSAMIHLELPHVNVLSKLDLVDKKLLQDPDYLEQCVTPLILILCVVFRATHLSLSFSVQILRSRSDRAGATTGARHPRQTDAPQPRHCGDCGAVRHGGISAVERAGQGHGGGTAVAD
jgi:hypothetical protein